MKKCCVCIPLRDGVTILGFLSLIICILEWVLTTAFKTDAEDGNSMNILRKKGDHIVSLITELANNEFDISVKEINDKTQLLLNCVTGESKCLKSNMSVSPRYIFFDISVLRPRCTIQVTKILGMFLLTFILHFYLCFLLQEVQ